MRAAAVPKIKPYTASRHAAASYLANRARVSPAVIAAWLGHSDAAFTMRTYVHARPEDLGAGLLTWCGTAPGGLPTDLRR